MARLRRAFDFALPTAVAACAASVVIGGVESMTHLGGGLRALAGVGFLCLAGIPAGVVVGVIGRGVWRGWQLDRAVEAARTETGGVPSIAGWLLYAALAAWGVFAFAFNTVWVLSWATGTKQVLSLAAAVAITALALALLVVSRPIARLLGWVIDRLDRAIHARTGRSVTSPRALIAIVAVASAATLVVSWFVTIAPRIGDFDPRPLLYAGGWLAILALVIAAWSWLERRPAVAKTMTVGWLAAGFGLAVTAMVVRFEQPYTMLEVWGEAPLAGGAIDTLWDVQDLRGELDLDSFAPQPRPGAAHPDIILVTIDTVRADRLPLYGGPARMPTLSALAKDGVKARWAFAPGNVTRRSLPSIATGVSPRRVHGRIAGWALRLDPRHVTLAERLRSAGYDTAGFFCCASQFARRHKLGLIRGIDHLHIQYDGNQLSADAAAWLAERRERGEAKPLFLWIHYIEPHRWDEDYTANEHGGNMKRRYDMALDAVDGMLSTLFAEAWREDRRDHTVLVVTSDHGEGLGDRGQKFHSTDLYNEQIRVPLVVAGPGIEHQVIDETVGLTSLAPTLLDLAGFVPPGLPEMDMPSIAPLLTGARKPDSDGGIAYSDMIRDRSNKKSWRAVIDGRYKLIEREGGGSYELYDLRTDPSERKNLARDRTEVMGRMKRLLDERRRVESQSPFP